MCLLAVQYQASASPTLELSPFNPRSRLRPAFQLNHEARAARMLRDRRHLGRAHTLHGPPLAHAHAHAPPSRAVVYSALQLRPLSRRHMSRAFQIMVFTVEHYSLADDSVHKKCAPPCCHDGAASKCRRDHVTGPLSNARERQFQGADTPWRACLLRYPDRTDRRTIMMDFNHVSRHVAPHIAPAPRCTPLSFAARRYGYPVGAPD